MVLHVLQALWPASPSSRLAVHAAAAAAAQLCIPQSRLWTRNAAEVTLRRAAVTQALPPRAPRDTHAVAVHARFSPRIKCDLRHGKFTRPHWQWHVTDTWEIVAVISKLETPTFILYVMTEYFVPTTNNWFFYAQEISKLLKIIAVSVMGQSQSLYIKGRATDTFLPGLYHISFLMQL